MVAPAPVDIATPDPVRDPLVQVIERVERIYKDLAALKETPVHPKQSGHLCTFTAQSIPTGIRTPIIFDFTLGCSLDSGLAIVNGSDTLSDPDRILIPDGNVAQTYFIYLSCTFAANATGYREIGWLHSDTSERVLRLPTVSGVEWAAPLFHYRRLITPTGWNAAFVQQNSGGNLNLTSAVFSIFRYK